MEGRSKSQRTDPLHKRLQNANVTQCFAYYPCGCSVCASQVRAGWSKRVDPQLNFFNRSVSEGEHRNFVWLMKQLAKNASTRPLEFLTPDIVVFKRGKPWFIGKQVDLSLKYISSGKQLGLTEIFKSFSAIARKKQEGKEVVMLRYTPKDACNTYIDTQRQDGPLRVLNEKEFFDMMYERPGSLKWRKIAYIQTVIKSRGGIGNTENVRYFSMQEYENPNYLTQICQQIAKLTMANSGFQILSMNAEFMIDDDKQFWFSYASDIYVKHIGLTKEKNYLLHSRIDKKGLRALHYSLDVHKRERSSALDKYIDGLKEQYENIKIKADINRILHGKPLSYGNIDELRSSLYERTPPRPKSTIGDIGSGLRNSERTWRRVNQFNMNKFNTKFT